MDDERTHASFFSGAGGLDIGLERAGWRTVSFSEIDPYASAVLAQRWPGVPNLGDITRLDPNLRDQDAGPWTASTLWTGGFPCQDLSVAGKRRGMVEGTRSNLAYAFLGLVGQHRPGFVLLENVPGLLSSHGGRDMAALVGSLVELGYGVGYRILDARYFGVPQRRRRVFILGVSPGGRAGAERAAEVLSVGSRCRRHPPTGIEAGPGTAGGPGRGIAHALSASHTRSGRYDPNGESYAISASPDPDGVRAPDGLAGRSHDCDGVADTLRVGGRASGAEDSYDNTPWVAETLNSGGNAGGFRTEPGAHLTVGGQPAPSDGLPLGLDSHRYRCCGNGVVSDVSFWIGQRLADLA